MEYKELDRMFEDSIGRLEHKKVPLTGAYNTLPLASDHFLIKKSWEYFRDRVKMIDAQWKQIVDSKNEEIKLLKTSLEEQNKRIGDLEKENTSLHSYEDSVEKVRLNDYSGLRHQARHLQEAWDAEREALERKISELQFQLERNKELTEMQTREFLAREIKLSQINQESMRELEQFVGRRSDLERQHAEAQLEKDSEIKSRESKIDLLRAEIERRDQLMKQLQVELQSMKKESGNQSNSNADLKNFLTQRDRDIENLKTQLDIIRAERDGIRKSWEREQAEWRELWDRGRQSWEREQNRLSKMDEFLKRMGSQTEKP